MNQIVALPRTMLPTTMLLWAVAALLLFGVFFLLQENGVLLSPAAAEFLHELTHDARHAVGVPCH